MARDPERLGRGDAFGYREANVPRIGERSAAWLGDAAGLIRRGAPAWPGLSGERLDSGTLRRPIMARLSGASSPYSWVEVYPDPDNPGWVDHPAARGGTANAYEVNAVAGLAGSVVRLRPGGPGDYRFQHVRIGAECVPPTVTVCYRNCNGIETGDFTVTLKRGGVTIDTCTKLPGTLPHCCTVTGDLDGDYTVEVVSADISGTYALHLDCGEDVTLNARGRTCSDCLTNIWPATLTLATPWGNLTLTRGPASYTGQVSIPNSDYYDATDPPDCNSIAGIGDCPAPNAVGDILVFFTLSCANNTDLTLSAGYLMCAKCVDGSPVYSFTATDDCIGDLAGCDDVGVPNGSRLIVNATVDFDSITLGGPTCIFCDSLAGQTLEYALDLSALGHGVIAAEVSGW